MFVVVTSASIITLCNSEDEEKRIYFILMLPFAENSPQRTVETVPDSLSPRLVSQATATYDDGHDIAPAAYVAVQEINNRPDLLKGYTLDLVRSDGGCNIIGRTVVSFARDVFHSNLSLLGMVGPSCSDSSTTIAQLTSHEEVSLVSLHYGAIARLGNREKYPNAFGMLGSTELWVAAYVELIKRNSWTNVALLFSDTSADFELANDLQQAIGNLKVSGYNLHTFPLLDTYFPLQVIKSAFTRVIFVLTTPKLSKRLLCLAYREGLRYPYYQFVFADRLESDFGETHFNYDSKTYNCSFEEMGAALNGHLNLFLSFNTEPLNLTTDTGLSYEQFVSKYEETALWYREHFNVHSNVTYWASPVYDAVWTLSFALNNSLNELHERNLSLLESKHGKRQEITNILRRNMILIDFQGVSGRVKFNESNGFTNRKVNLFRYNVNQTTSKIGFYESGQFTIISDSENILEPTFISSCFVKRNTLLTLNIAVPILVLSSVTVFFALSFHTINILYRNHHIIKATSSRLNHLIFTGGYMIIFGIVVLTLSEVLVLHYSTQTTLCNIAPYFLSIGLTLIIGTVCFKTWRLYKIFVKWKKNFSLSVLLQDNTLIGFVLLLTLVDVLVCVLWTTVDTQRPANTTTIVTVKNQPLPIAVSNTHCHSANGVWWLSIIILHKCVILSFSLFFAYSTRKVHNKDFQTKNVTMLVYTFTALFGIGFPLYVVTGIINVDEFVHFVVLCAFMDIAVCTSFLFLFLSPVLSLYRKWDDKPGRA